MHDNKISLKVSCQQFTIPVTDVLEIISGKWVLPVIMVLLQGEKKFTELERILEGITARTLSKELKNLEANELVKRTVIETAPMTVNYSLTEYGNTIQPIIAEIRKWGIVHRERMLRTHRL